MGQLREIYDGYKNLFFVDEEIEKEADKRIEECSKCVDDKGEPTVKYLIRKLGLFPVCGKCWCYIFALTHSPTKKCLLGKF